MAPKILLAEDEEFIASIYKLNFEKKGAEVRVAHNGLQVLEILKDFSPNVILLDAMMPEMDGFETLKKISEKKYPFPVVMLTNLSQEIDKQKFDALGARDYIVKSDIDIESLWSRIQPYFS
jgi:DNA-binding response OmpR family regulator